MFNHMPGPEEHAASIYHMIHEGDHVISVNDKDVQYVFDVSASMKKAQVRPLRGMGFSHPALACLLLVACCVSSQVLQCIYFFHWL